MQKIKAFLLIRDSSFFFNIHYPDLPFTKKIKIPEGNLEVCLVAPTSNDFKSKSEKRLIDLGQLMIEKAEKGLNGESDLLVVCPVLVILEQEVQDEIISDYKAWRNYISKLVEKEEGEKAAQQPHDERGKTFPKYHMEMFKVCRKYLKYLLLSLREKGNVCKLKFYDYNQPENEIYSGLFGRYYFDFQLQDESGTLLFDVNPTSLIMIGDKPKKSFMIQKRLSDQISKREENLITIKLWEHICADLKYEYEPDLARIFLLDAQDEALSGNISMAVVCIAIACEILTDRLISAEAKKIGNPLYDYIINKDTGISVINLLHVPLKSLIGYSVKEKYRDLWNDLQKLFEARNKVAHEGKCYYMSTTGKNKNIIDHKKTMHFIERAYELFEILEDRNS
jgi:hypothetical protein